VIDQKNQGAQAGQQAGGQGAFPIDNNTYNLMQLAVSKSEAIEVYQKYMKDADQNTKQMLQRFMQQDQADVQQIMTALKSCFRG
jgi:hypothetical protein